MSRICKIYTDIMPDEYDVLIAQADQDPSGRLVQKYLAYHVTKLVHGEDEANKAKETAEKLFGGEIDINDPNIPELSVSEYIDNGKLDLVELLASSGAVKSKREARELIDAGAITIGDEKITMYVISLQGIELLLPKLIRIGKKKYYRLVTGLII